MNTLQLIGYGKAEAKKVSEFKIGERLLWNYGGTSEILDVVSETKAFVTFSLKSSPLCKGDAPLYHERRMKKNRLAAFA